MHTTLILRNPQTRKEPGGNFPFFPLLQFLMMPGMCSFFSIMPVAAWKDLQSSVNIIKVEMERPAI